MLRLLLFFTKKRMIFHSLYPPPPTLFHSDLSITIPASQKKWNKWSHLTSFSLFPSFCNAMYVCVFNMLVFVNKPIQSLWINIWKWFFSVCDASISMLCFMLLIYCVSVCVYGARDFLRVFRENFCGGGYGEKMIEVEWGEHNII